jgi:hypothetical protein
MTNHKTYKIEVFCNGELQVTSDSPDAEKSIQQIRELLTGVPIDCVFQKGAEKICRKLGWVPVSELMEAWGNSDLVVALRAVHWDIDEYAEDFWGPKSGLKFWNAAAGDYSHAPTWTALYAETKYER